MVIGFLFACYKLILQYDMVVLCVSENRIKNTRTVFRHCWSGRKGRENLLFAGV